MQFIRFGTLLFPGLVVLVLSGRDFAPTPGLMFRSFPKDRHRKAVQELVFASYQTKSAQVRRDGVMCQECL
ncbi:MAG: hypothetical protein M2R45_02181 [Verrucomicrobia subdivision 3 bacterium]|nr:hypothetical protein [Limisphaerales bacterium]MCS1413757.1 hypothetical protein [Limisphaerales bacterium]